MLYSASSIHMYTTVLFCVSLNFDCDYALLLVKALHICIPDIQPPNSSEYQMCVWFFNSLPIQIEDIGQAYGLFV